MDTLIIVEKTTLFNNIYNETHLPLISLQADNY